MAIRTIAPAVLAALGLTACASYEEPAVPPVVSSPQPSATPRVALATLQPGSYRPGSGIIESIGLIALPASSASAGATAAPVPGPYRLTLRMDDGTIQTLVQNTRALLVGDRVQITADGRLIRP